MIKENAESTHRNTLIIIGNGFDLAHGLKTSYRDYLFKQFDDEINEISKGNKDDYNSGFLYREKLKSVLVPYKTIQDLIEKIVIHENKEDNLGFKVKNSFFLTLLNKLYLNNWVDIENEYFNELINIIETQSSAIDEFQNGFRAIVEGLNTYIEGIEISTKQESINKYFQQIVDNIDDSGLEQVHVLNFNYTSTPELYIEKEKVNYIHGKLFDEQNPIVFGYGNETHPKYKQIEDSGNKEYLRFLKSYAYLQTNNYHNFLKFIESDNFDVIIMGHSCGMSDGVMLKTIFEHSNCQNIIIKYYEYMNSDGKIINDFFSKTQEIARHFSDKALFRKKVLPISNPAVTPLVPLHD